MQMSEAGRIASAAFFALVGIGFGGALLYEAFAIFTGLSPTISKIVAGSADIHPRLSLVVAFIAGAVVMALAAHFADVLALWKP